MKPFLITVSIILIAVGVYVSIEFFIIISSQYSYVGSGPIKMDATGQAGDFIGGIIGTIFSLAGFFMLVLTLRHQSDSFRLERLENNFFDLIKFHRDNVQEFTVEVYEKDDDEQEVSKLEKQKYEGRKVFIQIFKQFLECSNELKQFFDKPEWEIFESSYLETLKSSYEIKKRKFPPRFFAKMDISYSIIFFGVSADGLRVLKEMFKNRYKEDFVDLLLKYISLKPARDSPMWSKWRRLSKRNSFLVRADLTKVIYERRKKKSFSIPLRELDVITPDEEIVSNYTNKYVKYYGGHQFRLGHYYRHLFQSVNYIDDQKFLSYKQKYNYVKTFRAQLSTYEQALLFLNSLSFMGVVWELFPDYETSVFPWIDSKRRVNKQLITKYNLIKNLPGNDLYGIQFKLFYPDVQYELDKKKRNNKIYI